jgi:hypothetical protein
MFKIRDLVVVILYGSIYNQHKIVPNTENFMIFAILHFYNFILVIDIIEQNNKISLHFNSYETHFYELVSSFLKFYYLLVTWW